MAFTESFEKTAGLPTVGRDLAIRAGKGVMRAGGYVKGWVKREVPATLQKIKNVATSGSKEMATGAQKAKAAVPPIGATPRLSPSGQPKPERFSAAKSVLEGKAKTQRQAELVQQHGGENASKKLTRQAVGNSTYNDPLLSGEKEQIRKKAPGIVKERAKNIKRITKGQAAGPSFAHRHPLMTAGAGLAAGKYMLGGGDKQQESAPQLMQPSNYQNY